MNNNALHEYLSIIEKDYKSGQATEQTPIRKLQELATRMARLTHMIRDIVIDAFEQGEASGNLWDLHQAFQDLLLPELKVSEFADMFAQTMAYGLFAAQSLMQTFDDIYVLDLHGNSKKKERSPE